MAGNVDGICIGCIAYGLTFEGPMLEGPTLEGPILAGLTFDGLTLAGLTFEGLYPIGFILLPQLRFIFLIHLL